MNRRDALKSLAAVAGATGMTVTPVTTQEAQTADLIVLKCTGKISDATAMRLKDCWCRAVAGTGLEHVKVLVLDSEIDMTLVRGSHG